MKVWSGFASLNNARFYFETAGTGSALVLVHAGITDARMWDEQFHFFAESFRVIRYDRRGFGRTVSWGGPFSHHEDLNALMSFLGIERAALLGCSQGGKTILDFTLENPSRTEALVLVASALSGFQFGGEEPVQMAELMKADEAGDVERVNELELQIWVDGPRRAPHEVDARMRERVREMNRIALSMPQGLDTEIALEPSAALRLDEIKVPTLVVTGVLDTPRTLATARALTEGIRGAESLMMKGTAHLPSMERAEEFNRHVLSFLKRVVKSAVPESNLQEVKE